MSRVLITGAHGFIGKHLAARMARAGHHVVGLGHGIWPASEAAAWGIQSWVNGDIVPGNLRALQHQAGTPDLVYHLAGGSSVGVAIGNPREDFFRTVATTAELLDWMRVDAPEARLIAVSSAAVYGSGHPDCITEDSPLTPFSPYGHHKRLMEELCHSYTSCYGVEAVIARLFSVYGPGLKKQLPWDLCARLASAAGELVLGGTGDEMRDWTDVRDVVRALELLGTGPARPKGAINVGTGSGTSVRIVAAMLARHWARASGTPERGIRFSGESRPGDPFSLVAMPVRLQALGFEWQIGVEGGFGDYVQWFRQQASLPA